MAGINGNLGSFGMPNDSRTFWLELAKNLGNIHKRTFFVLQGGPDFLQSKVFHAFSQAFPDWEVVERFFVPATKNVEEPQQVATDFRLGKVKDDEALTVHQWKTSTINSLEIVVFIKKEMIPKHHWTVFTHLHETVRISLPLSIYRMHL